MKLDMRQLPMEPKHQVDMIVWGLGDANNAAANAATSVNELADLIARDAGFGYIEVLPAECR
jgi:hypothetical protein